MIPISFFWTLLGCKHISQNEFCSAFQIKNLYTVNDGRTEGIVHCHQIGNQLIFSEGGGGIIVTC